MSAPVIWIILPASFSILLFFTRRGRNRFIIFAAISLILALSTLVIKVNPTEETAFYEIPVPSALTILGRSFILTQEDSSLVRVVYFFNAVWASFGYFFDKDIRVIPLGMLHSAMLLAAYSVTPFLYASLIIALAVILSVPLILDNQNSNTHGVARYLVYQILALPFILLAGWFLAGGEITPVNPEQLVQAALLLGLGFVLWLGVFPFHSWVSLLYREANPINLGFILQMQFFVTFLIVLKFIDGFSWLRQYTIFFQAFLVLGAIMQLLGSLGIFFQNNLKDINGYALLHMVGVLMTSLGVYSFSEVMILPQMFAVYLIGLSILHITLAYVDMNDRNPTLSILQSDKWFLPAMLGYVYGLGTLCGLPLTFGFAPTQWVYQTLARTNEFYFWVFIASKVIISISGIRLLKVVFERILSLRSLIPKNFQEWFMIFFLSIVVISGLFPKLVYGTFEHLMSSFENLIQ